MGDDPNEGAKPLTDEDRWLENARRQAPEINKAELEFFKELRRRRPWWKLWLAYWRIAYVCEMSEDLGLNDYHDYYDSTIPEPWHMYKHVCRKCGKEFTI